MAMLDSHEETGVAGPVGYFEMVIVYAFIASLVVVFSPVLLVLYIIGYLFGDDEENNLEESTV